MEKHFVEQALNKISSEKYDDALCDLRKVIKFNSYIEIAYVLKISACLHLGDLDGLKEGINELKLYFPRNENIKTAKEDIKRLETLIRKAKKFSIQKKYDESVKQINLALQIATASKYLNSLKNQYMIDEKDQIEKAYALYNSAFWFYSEADLDACFSNLSNLIYVDPYHKDAEKLMMINNELRTQNDLGDSHVAAIDYTKAKEIYKEATKIDPKNKKIISVFHNKIAAINFHLLQYDEASVNATKALEFNPDNINALTIRAKCYSELQDFENCIKDCNLVLMVENNEYIKILLDENSSRLFLKVTTARAYLNFNKRHLMDCVNDCEAILQIKEINEIRNLLEISTNSLIIETMEYARELYNNEQYEMCISQCDILITKFQNVPEAINLKLTASNHKSIVESIYNAKNLHKDQNYKECLKLCERTLLNINLVDERKPQYIAQVNQMVQNIRDRMKAIQTKANLNFKNMNFDECVKDLEYILSIEESSEIEELLKSAKSEKSFEERLTSAKKLYETKQYADCIERCKALLKVRELNEIKQLIASSEMEIEKIKKIKKLIEENMCRAEENFNLKKFEECIKDCLKILAQNESYLEAKTIMNKAFVQICSRAKSYYERAQYKECINVCMYVKSTPIINESFNEVKGMLKHSSEELAYFKKITKEPLNHYSILKVKEGDNKNIIKESFYSLSKQYHPDKHSKSTKEMRTYCQEIMKKITVAYNILSNPKNNTRR